MKEQDYIQIMNRIRKDHIENAMMWEAPVQQNRRSIRRLSAGVGAIAAAIAVCVGVIGYTGSLGMLTATNDIETESAVSGTAETDPSAVTEAVTVYDPASVETTETTSETLPETAPAETNIFGGTGTLRTFQFSDLNSLRF